MSAGSNLTWVGLGLVGFALLGPTGGGTFSQSSVNEPIDVAGGEKPDAASEASSQAGNGLASRELIRAPDGHFYADAQVNGARVRFMIDTGASMVVLTPADAQRAAIALPSERMTARGAGGEIEVIPVSIDRMAIGPLEARNVRAAVAEQVGVSLLGQSFLSQVGRVEISGDRMVLR